MKKLLSLLCVLSVATSASVATVSCNNAPNLNTKTSFPDEMSIFNKIDTSFFNDNKIIVHKNYDEDVLNNFVDTISKQSSDVGEDLVTFLKSNMRVILMANDLISQIGKIPGYHWMTEKLLTQGSKFDIYDKSSWKSIKDNHAAIISRFISSFLNINDFGLSVTFFNENLDPWNPTLDVNNSDETSEDSYENLRYARVNINQKISVLSGTANVDLNNSNMNAVHYYNGSQIYKVGTPIVDENYIYQGWVTSTNMIDLKGLVSDEKVGQLKVDDLFITPSAADLINNVGEKKIDIQIDVNKILEDFNSKFFKDIDQELTNNPIYLGDNITNKTVAARLYNISFGTFFNILLTRKDISNEIWKNYYDYSDDETILNEKIIKVTKLSDSAWSDVFSFINSIDVSALNNSDKEKASSAIDELTKWFKIDKGNSKTNENIINDDLANKLQNDLKLLLTLSAQMPANGGEQPQISNSGWFKVSSYFYMDGNPSNKSLIEQSSTDLSKYGNNNDYNFAQLFYCPVSGDTNSDIYSEFSNQIYNPDSGLSLNTPKMADKGFLNVSAKARFGSEGAMYQTMIKSLNDSKASVDNHLENPYVISDVSGMDISGVYSVLRNEWKNQSEDLLRLLDQMDHPELGYSWFESDESGFLKNLEINGIDDLTSDVITQKYEEMIRKQVRSWFTYDDVTNTMPIWDTVTGTGKKIGFSFDRSTSDFDKNNEVFKYDSSNKYNQDDDIAFAKMVGNNSILESRNPLYPTQYNNFSSSSPYNDYLYNYGYDDKTAGGKPVYQEYSIAFANVTSYGETKTKENVDDQWFKSNSSYLSQELESDSSTVAVEKKSNYYIYKNKETINYKSNSDNMYDKCSFLAYIPITPENYDSSTTKIWKSDENGNLLPTPSWWKQESDDYSSYIKYRYALVNLYKYFVLENPDKKNEGYNPNYIK